MRECAEQGLTVLFVGGGRGVGGRRRASARGVKRVGVCCIVVIGTHPHVHVLSIPPLPPRLCVSVLRRG